MVTAVVSSLAGVVVGVLVALPAVGPVTITVVQNSLLRGRQAGLHTAAGAGLVDALLCFVALLATGAISNMLNFLGAHPIFSLSLQLLFVAVIVVYGVIQLQQPRPVTWPRAIPAPPAAVWSLQQRGAFFVGAGMALMNIASPTFTSTLAYVGLLAHEFRLVSPGDPWSIGAFALGFGLGNFLWLQLLASGIHHFRQRLNQEALERLYRLVGVVLIGVGTMLGIRVLATTRWHDIFRLLPAF
ncbi:MAG: LysE family transporter [Candidatus Kapabacteria bacterium]|nr:LysE family transporter [Candidatus Kapabacteria bacterium]MDW8011887.1 LysE family transporter [Bacteroidota bacterium]